MDLSNARALTVKQPWASLIACGAKQVENRSWPIPQTWKRSGPLLIHAGASVDRDAMTLSNVERALVKRGIHGDLPHGVIVAVVARVSCHEARWGCCYEQYAHPDGWHWILDGIRTLPRPIRATGRLGLWKPDAELLAAIEAQYTQMEVAW